MNARAGQLRQKNVARNNQFLPRRGPTAQAENRAPVTFVNDAVGDEGIILAMIHDREIEHAGVFHGAAHQLLFCTQCPSSVMAMMPACLSGTDGGQLFARDIFRNGPGDKNVHLALAFRALSNERRVPTLSMARRRIGHANHRGKTTARGRGSASGDGLLGRLSRFAQMDMEIDKPRANDLSCGIKARQIGRSLDGRRRADGGNFAIQNEKVRRAVKSVGRVNHPSASDEERFGQGVWRGVGVGRTELGTLAGEDRRNGSRGPALKLGKIPGTLRIPRRFCGMISRGRKANRGPEIPRSIRPTPDSIALIWGTKRAIRVASPFTGCQAN